MASSEKSGGFGPQRIQRVDLQRKISLKFKELQGFITEYSENLSIGGMFIRTQSPPPPGTVFDFEFTLGEDYRLIHGIGEVVWVRGTDEDVDRPAGMGVRFLSLDPESEKLIDRIVADRLKKEGRAAASTETVPGGPWVERVLGRPERAPDGAPAAAVEPGPQARSEPGAVPEQLSIAETPPPPAAEDGPLTSPPPGASAGAEAETGEWGLLSGPLDLPELPEPGQPVAPAAAEPTPEETRPPAPVPTSGALIPPSPMATSPYARSYRGAAVAGTPKGHRTLVAVVLVVLVLVAAAAVMVLFFPEASVRWLVGGRSETTPVQVAEGPSAAANEGAPRAGAAASRPAESSSPVASQAQGQAPAQIPVQAPVRDQVQDQIEVRAQAEPPAEPPAQPPAEASPAATRPAPRPPAPKPEPVAQPAPAKEPAPSAAESGTFSRVLNVIWEPQGDELQVTIFLDGPVEEWQYSVSHLASPPRELVRIRGVREPFPRSELPVSSDLARRIRIGFHPERRESELHVVVDLAGKDVILDRSEAVGKEIRLYFAKGEQ